MSTAASAPPLPRPPFAWGQFLALTAGAAVVFALLRLIPTGSDLNHMDFRVEGKGAIEFCDPANPQFIPVVAVKSPVVRLTVELKPLTAAVRSDSPGSKVTELADRLTEALSKVQAPFTLLAFNCATVTVSDVNSSNL